MSVYKGKTSGSVRRITGPLVLMMAIAVHSLLPGEDSHKVRPLASETVLYRSPDPAKIYALPAGLAVLPGGRLVAAYQISGKSPGYESNRCYIHTSDDGGKTWVHRANTDIHMSTMFVAGESLYLMGQRGGMRISRSDDRGETWTSRSELTTGERWTGYPQNVLISGQNVYLVMDRRLYNASSAWPVAEYSPHLLRGDVSKDLLDPASWTRSSPDKAFIEYVNDQAMETLFGVPFYPSYYPERYAPPNVRGRSASPVGWLEGNVVQIRDPSHYLYDPSGKTFHMLLRSNTGLTNIGSLLKVTENENGTMTTSVEKALSGKDLLFIPIPGGQQTFAIHYDEATQLYWMLSTQTTDSMTRGENLTRFGMAFDERVRLQLHFSRNLFDWCFAGLAAMGGSEKEARHCVSMAVDGDDIIFLSRSGDDQALSAHNCNLITFHRIKNFRSLVY